MGSGDGSVQGLSTLLNNGPNNARFNLVLVAEGFQASEQGAFNTLCDSVVAAIKAEPWYGVLGSAINVHRLNVASNESGADDPVTCGDGSTGSGATKATYFDATFCSGDEVRRCLNVDGTLVMSTVDTQLSAWHSAAVLVNTTEYGGCSGGKYFATSVGSDVTQIVLHELGHSAFRLGDEYSTLAGCGSGEVGHDNPPAGSMEPGYPNVTLVNNLDDLKWAAFVQPQVPIPTMLNPDCSDCDDSPNVLDDDLEIGLFEGANYFHCGCFRPAYNCRMRDKAQPFCRVCLEAANDRLSDFMTPSPHLEVVTDDASHVLEYGNVASGLTLYRKIEVRNVRTAWPGDLHVTLSPIVGPFAYTPGTSMSFTLPAPVLEPFTFRPVFVAYTAPSVATEAFGSFHVDADDPTNPEVSLQLHAHSVMPNPVDAVLVIDHSGSMSEPTGVPGRSKRDLAIDAGNLFVSLLRDTDQIGVVRFSDKSDSTDVLLNMTTAGPAMTGAGRVAATSALSPNNLAPSGSTSIGAGLENGSAVLDHAAAAARALVVLTDGIQNTNPDISTGRAAVTGKTPKQRVFSVGLGLNQLENSLVELASVTNGVAQVTGELSGWREFLLQKLYVQILSDIADEAFVHDPRSVVLPGQRQATDINIGETDAAVDFIIVTRAGASPQGALEVWLEAPDHAIVRPQDVPSLLNFQWVQGVDHGYFRVQLPAFPGRPQAHVGRWRVWVRSRDRQLTRGTVAEYGNPAGAIWYSVMAKARSNFLLNGKLTQSAYGPGSPMAITLEPTLYGQPITLDQPPRVVVVRPDDVFRNVTAMQNSSGSYTADFTDTALVGPYSVMAQADHTTETGLRLSRYRQLTGLIYVPGVPGRPGEQNGGSGHHEGGGPTDKCCDTALRLVRDLENVLRDCCKAPATEHGVR